MALYSESAVAEKRWLVTGAAGFIGSHLVTRLLELGAEVVALDNFATGRSVNLEHLQRTAKRAGQRRFTFISGDIRDSQLCRGALAGVDVVSHQAALGSVPRSVQNPSATFAANVQGYVTLLQAARDLRISRIVYASSSSVYGDSDAPEKHEGLPLTPRSPYAVSKLTKEQLSMAVAPLYEMSIVGLRYFNVFGPRQDPNGVYAAVIPRWIAAMERGERCTIYGDGKTSRDFCYVENVIDANLRAGVAPLRQGESLAVNVAVGDELSLLDLHSELTRLMQELRGKKIEAPAFAPFREGDVRRSRASVQLAYERLGYRPLVTVREGLTKLLRG